MQFLGRSFNSYLGTHKKFPLRNKKQVPILTLDVFCDLQYSAFSRTQIAAQFQGTAKTKATISKCLAVLKDFGVILSHTETEPPKYYAIEL
jgi:hypothetical protein